MKFTSILSVRIKSPEIESRWGENSEPFQTGPWAYPASCAMNTGPFSGIKAAGAWVWPPTLSSVEVGERVELYVCCRAADCSAADGTQDVRQVIAQLNAAHFVFPLHSYCIRTVAVCQRNALGHASASL